MKHLLAVFVLPVLATALSATAQSADALYQRACGPQSASFDVQLVKGKNPAAPEPGKALVYFIQTGHSFTTRIGLDGSWAGVLLHNSYFFASLVPGEHHACAATLNRRHLEAELLHFNAEAGKSYFFRVRGLIQGGDKVPGPPAMEFAPSDSDEALALIASDQQSAATPKP
jgi:hypothetical protein